MRIQDFLSSPILNLESKMNPTDCNRLLEGISRVGLGRVPHSVSRFLLEANSQRDAPQLGEPGNP